GILDAAAVEKVKSEAWPTASNADELHDALVLIGVMTPDEIHRSSSGEEAEQLMSTLVTENRATRLVLPLECGDRATAGPPSKRGHVRALSRTRGTGADKTFYVAAERLPMLRAIYPNAIGEQELVLPVSLQGKTWERADAIRELVRGRLEVCGPVTATQL